MSETPPSPPAAPRPQPGRRKAESARVVRRSRRSAAAAAAAADRARRANRPGTRIARRRFRRTHGLPGTLGVTLLGALLPGSGFLWSGRRLLGWCVLLPAVAVLAGGAWYVGRDLEAVLDFVFSPTRLQVAAALLAVGLLVWVCVVYLTYRQVRPRERERWQTAVGHAFVLALCLLVGFPFALAARYALVQADLVETVFEGNTSATAPRDVSREDPWGGRERVNVLLLGGDGGEGRTGVRTDTVVLVSMDTGTGRTVMFSLPRNMMNAQFPEDSPLHDLYPEGYSGPEDDGFYMLNAIYGQIPTRHPGVLGRSENEGADAVKQAVEGSLGVPVDYYVLVNLKGFEEVVDAMGGITVNVNEPVAINGDTDAGIPPTGYIDPGPDQHLDGFHALWFARGRWGSDDYERMERQRCTIDAIIEAADPANLIRRYQALAAAGKEIVYSDIPLDLVPAFVELALKVKNAQVRSVVFRASEEFFSGDPDFAWVQDRVADAIDPPKRRDRPTDPDPADPDPTPTDPSEPPEPEPGAAVDAEDSCAYDPDASVVAATG
ncbi:LCP family protein [Nocardioides dongkuii]|uniref:LCP family protein n=1 Tax=Nocardioides dongkuii TaxID=2760089 RepID=UPI0015F7BE0C|nr:LCP family protein [Nocardioides dongkuii]